MKDKNGKDVTLGSVVLVPFRVIKLGGHQSPLVHLETAEAYGHEKGRTKTALWAEPSQLEVADSK